MKRRVLIGSGAYWAAGQWTWATHLPSAGNVDLAVMPHSLSERRQLDEWVAQYNQRAAGPRVEAKAYPPERYKADIGTHLASSQAPADVYYWFAGQRLIELVEQGLIAPLDDFWAQHHLDQAFGPALRAAVSWRGRPYAIPLNYYPWGFFYRKSIFERHRWNTPRTWRELVALAQQAQSVGMAPTASGGLDRWTLAAWFDYLNLRLNGLPFHQALTAGTVPFTDERVRRVFTQWRGIRDQHWYDPDALQMTWRDALPYLLRGRAATMLMGNFFIESVPTALRPDMGFFPFPQMSPSIPRAEEAPIDVLVLSKRAQSSQAARDFLAWSASAQAQAMLAATAGKLPANTSAPLNPDPITQQSATCLRQAAGLSQFFDRDAGRVLAEAALSAFSQFVLARISEDQAMAQIETARQAR